MTDDLQATTDDSQPMTDDSQPMTDDRQAMRSTRKTAARAGRTRAGAPGPMRPHTTIHREGQVNTRQKQVMDSYVRVVAFLEAHPASGTMSYASAREMLDDVIQRVRTFAGAQHTGRDASRMELRRQQDWGARIVEDFMRPIVTIARAQIGASSDVGLPEGLRMPKLPQGPTKLIALCDGMIAAARPYEALFVAHGMPADFLAQFTAARNGLESAMGARASQVVTHVAARTGLKAQFLRGRRAIDRLDAVVRSSYRRDRAVLDAWRVAKRVQLVPGVRSVRGVEADREGSAEAGTAGAVSAESRQAA